MSSTMSSAMFRCLANPVFADYMQAYGEGGLRAESLGAIDRLARLYWYTVEFGLVRERGEVKLYGAGIVSSYGESIFALDDASPNRLGFDLRRLMRTPYRIDDYQQTYFVIDSFEDLLRQTIENRFRAALYRAARPARHRDRGDPADRSRHPSRHAGLCPRPSPDITLNARRHRSSGGGRTFARQCDATLKVFRGSTTRRKS